MQNYVREGIRIANRSIFEMDVRDFENFWCRSAVSLPFCRNHSLQSGSNWNDFQFEKSMMSVGLISLDHV
jgi:hypothetical protein